MILERIKPQYVKVWWSECIRSYKCSIAKSLNSSEPCAILSIAYSLLATSRF
jgi:hypothetical protein